MKTCWGRSTGCFIYSFAIQVGEETLCSKGFTSNLRDILHENNRTIIPTYLVTKSLLYSFCPFLQTENKKVGGLSTRNISAFCLYQDALYSKAIPNSIEFYKGIFLHVILVRIIVSCVNLMCPNFVFANCFVENLLPSKIWMAFSSVLPIVF